jgi:hypothetical protein
MKKTEEVRAYAITAACISNKHHHTCTFLAARGAYSLGISTNQEVRKV